jgi:hypothetical protein
MQDDKELILDKQLVELKKIKNELIVDNLLIFDSGLQPASASITTPAQALANPIITFTTPNTYTDLFSIQLYWDSTFGGNFLYYLHIDTIQNLSTSTFRVPVGTGIDIASGYKIRLKPYTTIRLYAYNNNSSNSANGSVGLFVEGDAITESD